MTTLDPIVHAALVTIGVWLTNMAFLALGLEFTSETINGLVTVIVGYILSLFGYSLWARVTMRARGLTEMNDRYVPPFTS